jgi:hypothetical protein
MSGSKAPRNEIPTANPMYSGSKNSMAILRKLHLKSESQKFKMSAANLEVPVSKLLYKIAKKFQRLPACFWGRENSVALLVMLFHETGSEKFKMAAANQEVPVTQLLYKIAKKFRQLSACFRVEEVSGAVGDSVTKPEVRNSWRGHQTGSTCASASIQDSK